MSYLCCTCEKKEWIRCLKEAGCDEAVFAYAPGTSGALRGFSAEELAECVAEAHACGMRALVSLDCLFHENEIAGIREDLHVLAAIADEIIYADPAVLYDARHMGYESRLIYDPMCLMTSSYEANAWLETGIGGAVISPLLAREELEPLLEGCGRCTLPVHGYQRMSVSGRSLLSAYDPEWKYRRDLSLQEEKRTEMYPVYEDERSTTIYTDAKLQSLRHIRDFEKRGAVRFVIRTEWMEEQEVMDTVRAYRRVMEGAEAETVLAELTGAFGNYWEGYYGQPTIL